MELISLLKGPAAMLLTLIMGYATCKIIAWIVLKNDWLIIYNDHDYSSERYLDYGIDEIICGYYWLAYTYINHWDKPKAKALYMLRNLSTNNVLENVIE